jgi:hypothetical protein
MQAATADTARNPDRQTISGRDRSPVDRGRSVGPTVNLREVDLVSSRLHNYQ